MLGQDQIPKLYSTEKIPFEEKIIYQRYHFPNPIMKEGRLYDARGFNWLLSELDRETEEAFGWVNLNNDENADWGYFSLNELSKIGAAKDERWIPLAFPEAMRLVYGYREQPGTKYHHDCWLYTNYFLLKAKHAKIFPTMGYSRFMEVVYKMEHGLF